MGKEDTGELGKKIPLKLKAILFYFNLSTSWFLQETNKYSKQFEGVQKEIRERSKRVQEQQQQQKGRGGRRKDLLREEREQQLQRVQEQHLQQQQQKEAAAANAAAAAAAAGGEDVEVKPAGGALQPGDSYRSEGSEQEKPFFPNNFLALLPTDLARCRESTPMQSPKLHSQSTYLFFSPHTHLYHTEDGIFFFLGKRRDTSTQAAGPLTTTQRQGCKTKKKSLTDPT